MRALVLWAEPASANLGVRVLAEGTAALLDLAFPGVEVCHQGYGPGDAPVRIGDPRKQLRRLVSRHDELTAWLSSFDLVVDTRAGDSFTDIYGQTRLFTMQLMHELTARAGVPVVLGPQTVGPFDSRRGRLLARRTVRTASATLARDSRSSEVARSLGARAVVPTTDVVFCLPQPPSGPPRDVVLNVSGLLWNGDAHVDSRRYRDVVRSLVSQLRESGSEVSLLAHVLDSPVADNDVPTVTALARELGVEAVVPLDLADARRIIRGARVVIGSRMHACLNALSVGTPGVALAYSRKFAPLLEALGWPHTIDLRADVDQAALVLDVVRAGSADDLAQTAASVRGRAQAEIERATQALRDAVSP